MSIPLDPSKEWWNLPNDIIDSIVPYFEGHDVQSLWWTGSSELQHRLRGRIKELRYPNFDRKSLKSWPSFIFCLPRLASIKGGVEFDDDIYYSSHWLDDKQHKIELALEDLIPLNNSLTSLDLSFADRHWFYKHLTPEDENLRLKAMFPQLVHLELTFLEGYGNSRAYDVDPQLGPPFIRDWHSLPSGLETLHLNYILGYGSPDLASILPRLRSFKVHHDSFWGFHRPGWTLPPTITYVLIRNNDWNDDECLSGKDGPGRLIGQKLPNLKELKTILDLTLPSPWMNFSDYPSLETLRLEVQWHNQQPLSDSAEKTLFAYFSSIPRTLATLALPWWSLSINHLARLISQLPDTLKELDISNYRGKWSELDEEFFAALPRNLTRLQLPGTPLLVQPGILTKMPRTLTSEPLPNFVQWEPNYSVRDFFPRLGSLVTYSSISSLSGLPSTLTELTLGINEVARASLHPSKTCAMLKSLPQLKAIHGFDPSRFFVVSSSTIKSCHESDASVVIAPDFEPAFMDHNDEAWYWQEDVTINPPFKTIRLDVIFPRSLEELQITKQDLISTCPIALVFEDDSEPVLKYSTISALHSADDGNSYCCGVIKHDGTDYFRSLHTLEINFGQSLIRIGKKRWPSSLRHLTLNGDSSSIECDGLTALVNVLPMELVALRVVANRLVREDIQNLPRSLLDLTIQSNVVYSATELSWFDLPRGLESFIAPVVFEEVSPDLLSSLSPAVLLLKDAWEKPTSDRVMRLMT